MKEKVEKIRKFINSQKLYMWLLCFIILINALNVSTMLSKKAELAGKERGVSSASYSAEKLANLEAKLKEKKHIVNILILITVALAIVMLIGLILNITFLIMRINGKEFIQRSLKLSQINWTAWDVAKVAILFLFFGYILAIIGEFLILFFPYIITQPSLKSIINMTILDILGILIVFYFVIVRYKHKLSSLGLTLKNFFKNVVYGVAGYVTIVPILVLVLIIIIWLADLFKYQPPPQAVLQIFMEQKKAPALIYMSFFVSVLGPIAEEIFFRGFMYRALKKSMGFVWALVLSSALFALLHAHLVGFFPILVLGILLAYLYEKTGSLISSVTVHIMHNSAMIAFVFLMKELSA